jgi:hypothetical protein
MSEILAGENRFRALLDGVGRAAHDRPLLTTSKWIVAPTLGAIIPGWLLAIPRRPVLNFKQWAAIEGERPESILEHLRQHLGLSSQEIIWFEHGPAHNGTVVGCGLDHAHIHVLLRPTFAFESFEATARSLANLNWQQSRAHDVYARLSDNQSYLIVGSADSSLTALDVEQAGSQFFRRVVSKLAEETAWDYRNHPHSNNIAATISTFRSLESATRRER